MFMTDSTPVSGLTKRSSAPLSRTLSPSFKDTVKKITSFPDNSRRKRSLKRPQQSTLTLAVVKRAPSGLLSSAWESRKLPEIFGRFSSAPRRCIASTEPLPLQLPSRQDHVRRRRSHLPAAHRALYIPEIMSAIFEHIDRSTPMKSNASQRKRRHSQMSKESGRDNEETDDVSGTLHNCMRVCKTWYPLARDVAEKRVSMSYAEDQRMSSWIDGPAKAGRARELVLHQCNIKQGILADIPEQPYLRSLEMYCCTSAIPPKSLLQSNLRSLSLPGCSLVSDQLLEYITQQCRGLVHLDLRACDLVSDRGLKAIAHYCRDLRYLNVGRVNKCENITSSGVSAIARRCVALETIGLAGTAVCDYGLIALARGPSAQTLQRLSVNECAYLTDHCVTILPDLPSLILFEIRGCHIQKASELVRWRNGVSGMGRSKRWVEAGEALNHAMHRFEHYAKYWMEMAQQVKDLSAPQTLVPRRRKRRQSLRGGSFDGRLR